MNNIMLAADGYYPNGMSRPWRKVEILRRMSNTDLVYIKYVDTGNETYAYEKHLKEINK